MEYGARCGYDYDDLWGPFLDDAAGEEDYYDNRELPYSMLGDYRYAKKKMEKAGKLLLLRIS